MIDATDQLVRGVMQAYGVPIANPRQWIPHTPTPRQELFLSCQDLEVFYGGAGFGGKTDAILMRALRYVDFPGYSAIIFRRSLQDFKLADSLLPRSHQWLDQTRAKYYASDMMWSFPADATLQLAYLDSDDDMYRYDSASWQFAGFDELVQFKEQQYRFMFVRLRRLADCLIPLQIASASNPPQPGQPGVHWVKERFIPDGWRPEDALENKVWRKPILYDEEELKLLTELLGDQELPQSRAFVPARMADNPYGDRQSYAMTLLQTDSITRRQRADGDWSIMVTGRQRFNADILTSFEVIPPTQGEIRLRTDERGNESIAFYPSTTGAVALWQRPIKKHRYAAGADTAEGIDREAASSSASPDYAAAHIADVESGEIVCRVRGRITESVFGELMYVLLRWYNNAFLVPEVKGGYGRAFLNKVIELGYPEDLIWNRHMYNEIAGQPRHTGKISYHDLGWDTKPTNRPTLIAFADDAINEHTIEIHDAITIEECCHFCYGPKKPEAERGYHDDTVISLCLLCVGIWYVLRARNLWGGPPRQRAAVIRYASTGEPVEDQRVDRDRVKDWSKRM